MTIRITRHFATVGGSRQVHYRRAGSGPPVILLHQSPTSSRDYLALIPQIAALGHTVIAPDTPGNGLSDPLPAPQVPEMENFADAVCALMTELGIDKAPVYGFHTGGVCALALGERHPGRVTVTITDGYVQLDAAEKEEILERYLPKYHYDWSGAHLTWAWARMREQVIFFPWYRKDTVRRLDFDMPPPAVLHDWLMDFLRAGDYYRKAYRAAFTFDCARAVQSTQAKTVITTTRTDVLSPCMDLLPPLPSNVVALRPQTVDESVQRVIQIIQENPSPQQAVAAPPARPMPGRVWADYLQIPGASLYCRRNTDGKGRPIVFVHASDSSSLSMDRYMQPLIGKRPLLAVDLPGNGESDNPMGSTVTVEAQASFLAQAIAVAGYDEVDVFGDQGGGCVGIELAAANPGLVRHLAVPTLPMLDEATRDEYLACYCPPIELEEYGAHLIKVWNMMRDRELFQPWYKRTRAHIRRHGEPDIAPEVIQRRTLDLFKCVDIYASAYHAHFTYPSLARLARVACPTLFGMPDSAATRRAMAAAKRPVARSLPADFAEAAAELLAFFDS